MPWQRVINAQGRVSTHPEEYGTRRQIERLRAEGIAVAEDGTLAAGLAGAPLGAGQSGASRCPRRCCTGWSERAGGAPPAADARRPPPGAG